MVFSSTGKYAQYGHVGIVVGEDANTITVKSSNWDGDGKITTEKVSKDSPMIEGYYNPPTKAVSVDMSQKAPLYANYISK